MAKLTKARFASSFNLAPFVVLGSVVEIAAAPRCAVFLNDSKEASAFVDDVLGEIKGARVAPSA